MFTEIIKYIKLFISQAIGDSGQGFFNFIIFFLFQAQLRALVTNGSQCCSQQCRRLDDQGDNQDESCKFVQPFNRSSEFSQYTLYV